MEIGLDIGLRNIYATLLDNDEVIESIDDSIYSHKRDCNKTIMEKVLALIHEVFTPEVKSIGVSLPSKTDEKNGVVYDLKNIPYWKGVGIKKVIEKEFNIPILVHHDINCFVLGERHYGLCKDFRNILSITLEPTAGTAFTVDGKLYFGDKTFISLNDVDCLSTAFYNCIRYYRKSYLRTLEELSFLCSDFEDEWISKPQHRAWSEIGMTTGRLISILLRNHSPEIIVLGGDLAKFYTYYAQYIDMYLEKSVPPQVLLNIIIVTSVAKNSKALGAANLNMERYAWSN